MRTTIVALAAALFGSLPASPLAAQSGPRFGLQVGFADDAEAGLGARIEAPLALQGARPLRFIGSFDLFFPDEPLEYWEVNANVAWQFRPASTGLRPYLGGGLGIARVSRDDLPDTGDTDLGLNLLGGVRFPVAGHLAPYLELRAELGGGDQLVLTFGLLF